MIIRLALEELGLAYQTVWVDRASNAHSRPEYLALNPAGLIPALETPDGPIAETAAILLWLSEVHGALAPAINSPERGAFLSRFLFVANTLHPALRMTFYPGKYVGQSGPAQAALRHRQQQALLQHYSLLEALIQTGPDWFGADAPSILDLYLGPCIRWTALYPQDSDKSWFDLRRMPGLYRMAQKLEMRDSVRIAQSIEGLGPTPFTAPKAPTPTEVTAT